MGATVTRKDPKTGAQRTYYKADNGKLYTDYNAAVAQQGSQRMAGSDGFRQALGNLWSQADRAVGGWLPGGGTPNLLTEGYDRPTGQLRQRIEKMGFDPSAVRVANLSTKRPIENRIAKAAADLGLSTWGHQQFGGKIPLRGAVIGINDNNISDAILKHEMAHATDPSSIPDMGRAFQGLSAAMGKPPLMRAATGLALFGDARAEDYAEGVSQSALWGKPTDYGDSLREEGRNELREAAYGAVGLTPGRRQALQATGSAVVSAAQAAIEPVDNWLTRRLLTQMDQGDGMAPKSWEMNALRGVSGIKEQLRNQQENLQRPW